MVKIDFKQLIRVGEGTIFKAPSTSRPGLFHFQIWQANSQGIICTCEGFQHQGHCWHIDKFPLCKAINTTPIEGCLGTSAYAARILDDCYFPAGHTGNHSWEQRGTPNAKAVSQAAGSTEQSVPPDQEQTAGGS